MLSLRKMLDGGAQRVFVAHAERRYAKEASEQLLALYQRQRDEKPELNGRALYESVVAERLGTASHRAVELVRRAEDSFTTWPVERDLTFRDVVHYLIFDEYTHLGTVREGTKTNMRAVVARIIPEDI
jgi:hypothetical protein